jgi:hypothetical protein
MIDFTAWLMPTEAQRQNLSRCGIFLCYKVPFAATPLLINIVIRSLLGGVTGWPGFVVEDWAYFAIVVAGETTVVTWAATRWNSQSPLLLALPIFVVILTTYWVALWHGEGARPIANQLFESQLRLFTYSVAILVALALVSAVANFLIVAISPDQTLTSALFVVRVMFASLPAAFTAMHGLAGPLPDQLFRANDVCFFAIAVLGPTVLDLTHSRIGPGERMAWSTALLLLIVWPAVLLGFYYFVRAVPISPIGHHTQPGSEIIKAIEVNAILSAILALCVAVMVQIEISSKTRRPWQTR